MIKYTMTQDSISLVHGGKSHVVTSGAPNFKNLRSALIDERWDDVPKHLSVAKSLETWAKGKFSIKDNKVLFDGKELPETLTSRISEMAKNGEDPNMLFLFWERLKKNPSHRSVTQLYDFLTHQNIPLTADGCFLAYKSITQDMKDHYTQKIDNTPGAVNEMPRNEISDDPDEPCHVGFHVGSIKYAQEFRQDAKIVVCKVNPEDVVCVPKDESFGKMRVCRYAVVGFYGTKLSSTYEEDKGQIKPEKQKKAANKSKKSKSRFDSMDMDKLMQQTLESLRNYATHKLHIIGASKILGGKTELVLKILEVRG